MTITQPTARRRRLAAAMLMTVGAGAALLGPQATASAAPPDEYVAVAYSPVDKFSGLSIHRNLDTAIAGALSRCGTKAGHCQLVAWSKNGCVALAVSGEYYYGWHGATYAEAQNGAIQRAGQGSTIKQSQCIAR